MVAAQTQEYLSKAGDFLAGMKLCSDLAEKGWESSSALLAVHSAISYGDALSIGLGQTATAAQDHKSRAPRLKKLLNERKYTKQQGIRHLENLLGYKTSVAYSGAGVTEKQVKAMIDHAFRFSTWANAAGSELKLKGGVMANLTEVQQSGRAKNAISTYLDKRLAVPKIFMNADWDGNKVDVLAFDRAGVGDAYIVTLLPGVFRVESDSTANAINVLTDLSLESQIRAMLTQRAQFRFVARMASSLAQISRQNLARAFNEFTEGFAEDGIGRVGVLLVDAAANNFEVQELVKAERFRSTKQILDMTDAFVQTYTPDLEYRDPVYEQESTV